MDVMLGEGNTNSIEREFDSIINGPEGKQDTQSLHNRENASQGNLENIRDIENRNGSIRQEGLSESINILSDEMNAMFFREKDSMMDLLQSHINRAISSAMNDRVVPEIQNIIGNLPLNRNGPEPSTSLNEAGISNAWKNKNTKFAKKDSRPLVISEKIRTLLLKNMSCFYTFFPELFSSNNPQREEYPS